MTLTQLPASITHSTQGTGRSGRAAVVAALAAWLTVGLGAGQAAAHADLVATTPAAEAVLQQPPAQIELTFSEDVQADFTQIAVLDPAGSDTATIPAAVEGAVVAQPVTLTAPGPYSVSYRIVSADGHTVAGTYSFTYTPPAENAASSPATVPSAGATDPVPSAAIQDASANRGADGLPVGWLLGAGAAAVAVLTAAVLRARRSPRP